MNSEIKKAIQKLVSEGHLMEALTLLKPYIDRVLWASHSAALHDCINYMSVDYAKLRKINGIEPYLSKINKKKKSVEKFILNQL